MHSSVCVSESQSLPGSYRQNSAHSRVSAQSPHSASGIRVAPLSEKREGGAWRGGLAGRFYTGAEFSGALVRAIRNETYFPMCFLSFLIKISKADLSVAEEGRLRQRLFFNWNMPRAVPHSSRGGGRLMAGHVEGTATD